MRTLTLLLATAAVAATTATVVSCVKVNAFKCDGDDNACGANGQCEADGFCSVSSESCPSGRQYSDTAGDLANQCVGGGDPTDGPLDPDGPPTDGPPPDVTNVGCVGYDDLPAGGQPNHKYKFIATLDDHSAQNNAECATTGGYLAIPNDAAELAGLEMLANGADSWMGVKDTANEGTFLDQLGELFAANCMMSCVVNGISINGNKMNDDCAMMSNETTLDIKSCGENHAAICECETE
jgi:hypothetical protein